MLTFNDPRPIMQGGVTDLRANWTPDGQWLVFERLQDGVRRLHRVRPDGSELERLALEDPAGSDSTGRPAFFAPDDFVFVSDRLGRPALFRCQRGQVRVLHAGPQACYGPTLGVTGAWPLLFFQQDGTRASHIQALEEDGRVEQLTTQPGVQDQPWPLPDGKTFVLHAQVDERNLVYVQALVPGAEPVCLSDVDEGTSYVTPFPSPDGQWIAFTSAHRGREQVWIMRPDGSARQQITHGEPHSFPAWSPDGQRLVYTQGRPTAEAPSGHLVTVCVS